MLFDVVPMAWDLPVCVNLHEATAFANWKAKKNNKNYRVSSELEHHAIRDPSQQLNDSSVDMVLRGPAHGKMMTEVNIITVYIWSVCIVPVYCWSSSSICLKILPYCHLMTPHPL